MAHKVKVCDSSCFYKPWQIRSFSEKKKKKVLVYCEVCKRTSSRKPYNRRAYKDFKENVYSQKIPRYLLS